MSETISFIHLGCQKCATTWLHRCFQAHPEVYVNQSDSIHYFDMHYHRGSRWYASQFEDAESHQKTGDTTVCTIRCDTALERLARDFPDVQILITIRNPIERAFSHYWHEKAKQTVNFDFEYIWNNYDLFQSFIETGYYADRIKRLYGLFKKEQVLVLVFDDLENDPTAFLETTYAHIGVSTDHKPGILRDRINRHSNGPDSARIDGTSEYERGMKPETRATLRKIYQAPNQALSELIGRDLSHWQ